MKTLFLIHKSYQSWPDFLIQVIGFGDFGSYAAKLHLRNTKMIGNMKKRNTIGESGIIL